MMPFLLHGRVLGGGGPPPGIIDPPGWTAAEYVSDVYVFGSPATATVSFTMFPDGTYTASSGRTDSGPWILPTGVGVGSAYKVRFTVTDSFGTAVVTNGAPTITVLSTARTITMVVEKTTGGSRTARRTVLLELFNASDVLVASGSFEMVGIAEYGT
ncbi:MAG: hypothetical protein ACRC6L_09955 [Steroidobacteraceae bacterium]